MNTKEMSSLEDQEDLHQTCCVCFENIDTNHKKDVQSFLKMVLENRAEPFTPPNTSSSSPKLKPALSICSNQENRHLMCEVCALQFVQHSANSLCPMCKSDLIPSMKMCIKLITSQKQVDFVRLKQQTTREQLQARIKQLRDSFSRRFEQQFFVSSSPKPSEYTLKVVTNSTSPSAENSYRSESQMSWQRNENGLALSTTMSGIIRAHENIEPNEWKRLVEHAMGITIASQGSTIKQLFIDHCNDLNTDLAFLLRWPTENLDAELLSDSIAAQTLNLQQEIHEESATSSSSSLAPGETNSNERQRGAARPLRGSTIETNEPDSFAVPTLPSSSSSSFPVPLMPSSRSWRGVGRR